MIRQDHLKDPITSGAVLERALKLTARPSVRKVEVLARLAMNKFIQGGYHESIGYHRKALEVMESLQLDQKYLVMGIYTKQANIFLDEPTGECCGLLSIVHENNQDRRGAFELETKAGKYYARNSRRDL